MFTCKTWLNNSAPNGLLLYKIDYILIKYDRCVTRVLGSVCVFIKQGYNYVNVFRLQQYLHLKVLCNNFTHRFIWVYMIMICSRHKNWLLALTFCVMLAIIIKTIWGDFNFPNINWACNIEASALTSRSLWFFVLLQVNGLTQLIRQPNHLDKALDLFLINTIHLLSNLVALLIIAD